MCAGHLYIWLRCRYSFCINDRFNICRFFGLAQILYNKALLYCYINLAILCEVSIILAKVMFAVLTGAVSNVIPRKSNL